VDRGTRPRRRCGAGRAARTGGDDEKEWDDVSTVLTFEQFTAQLREELLQECSGDLRPETHLFEDLGLDSLEVFHVVVFIEDVAGVEIAIDDPPPLETVQDAYDYYRTTARPRPGFAVTV
jgi:acyl carrier protein